MSKWTQEQREVALVQMERISYRLANQDRDEYVVHVFCQRNELLEALKLLTADNANRGSAGAEVNWAAIHLAQSAIAKAEAQ